MNVRDLSRLERLRRIIAAVPFPNMTSSTAAMRGLIAYERDARALRPVLLMAITSLRLENIARRRDSELMIGIDYHDPETVLEQIELWIADRKAANWQDASSYSFEPYLTAIRLASEKLAAAQDAADLEAANREAANREAANREAARLEAANLEERD